MTEMTWSTALSRQADFERALDAVASEVLAELGGEPDLVCVFVSPHHAARYDALPAALAARLGPAAVLGCSASGVIGGGAEVEQQAAIGITAARLPGVTLDVWHVEADDLAPGSAHSARLAAAAGSAPRLLVLAEPFSFPTERLLRSLETVARDGAIAGGLASGGQAAGEMVLFERGATRRSGALIAAFSGAVEMLTAVAQGCRPIGDPMFVSACAGSRLSLLDGRRPLDAINALYAAADARDRELMQRSLFVGLAMRPGSDRYGQGDFLIRNIVGADHASGALRVAAELHEQQVIQFHLRDADTSAADLRRVLARLDAVIGERRPAGALLFSCTGRGAGLYGRADHDSDAFHDQIGELPLGGFFCNGEIGQVGGLPFVHGYTSAFAVFRPPAPE